MTTDMQDYDDAIMIDANSLQIISGFLEGNSDAISDVYTRFVNQLVSKAKNHIPEKFQAKIVPESIVNSVFQSIIEINDLKKQKYHGYYIRSWDQLYGLLATMTYRKCQNRIRSICTIKRSGNKATSEQLDFIASLSPSPQEEAEYGELLGKLLNAFTPFEYEILQARMSGLTVDLIAMETKITTTTIKSTIKRLQRKVSKIIASHEVD